MIDNRDKAWFEREYSPSSCIEDINVYIQQYCDQSQAVTQQAIANNTVIRAIQYGTNEDEVLDLYLPVPTANNDDNQSGTQTGKKLQVYIHGGYWQELSKDESSFAAPAFQQAGHYFAVINYSLAPKASLTEIVQQNRKALVWLATNAEKLGFDADEIYLSGSSAGAHLCLMMLQTNWQEYLSQLDGAGINEKPRCQPESQPNSQLKSPDIRGVCAVSGIYDIEPLLHTTINDPLQLTAQEVEANSPLKHATPHLCPVIIAYGDNETNEFKRQSLMMKTQLEQEGFELTLGEISQRNHFDVILDLGQANSWLFKQVQRQMQD